MAILQYQCLSTSPYAGRETAAYSVLYSTYVLQEANKSDMGLPGSPPIRTGLVLFW